MFKLCSTLLQAFLIFRMGRDNPSCVGEDILQFLLLMNEQISSTAAHENLDSTNTIHSFHALQICDIVVCSTNEEPMMGNRLL